MTGIVFAVVGPSGCGKSALIERMLELFPNELVLLPSLTTRPPRSAEDDRSTRFVSRVEFERLIQTNALVQWVEYAGNLYGDTLRDVDGILESGCHAIRPLVETSVLSFRYKGYQVAMIRIAPVGQAYQNRHPERATLDAVRAARSSPADVEVLNSFEPGGFESAALVLSAFIQKTIGCRSR